MDGVGALRCTSSEKLATMIDGTAPGVYEVVYESRKYRISSRRVRTLERACGVSCWGRQEGRHCLGGDCARCLAGIAGCG